MIYFVLHVFFSPRKSVILVVFQMMKYNSNERENLKQQQREIKTLSTITGNKKCQALG